jgi:hypothetical protein
MELSDLSNFERKEKGVENLLMQIKHGSNKWEKEECCCTNDAKKNMELKLLYHIDEDNSDENDSIIMIYNSLPHEGDFRLLNINSILECHDMLISNDPSSFRNTNEQNHPFFMNEKLIKTSLNTLIENCNFLMIQIEQLSEEDDDECFTKLVYKTKCFFIISIFLIGFLVIRPFNDGNNRLAKILCSFYLSVLNPFPFTIVANKDEFIQAVMEAIEPIQINTETIKTEKEAEQLSYDIMDNCNPSKLCLLFIKGCFSLWKKWNELNAL